MEPLDERQIKALRKASGITTLKIFLDMNDFMLDLATKGRPKGRVGEAGPGRSWHEAKTIATLFADWSGR